MIFIEMRGFSRARADILDDDEFRALQQLLLERPDAGAVIPGTGGVRKLRWAVSARGKRGGARIIYYWAAANEQIFLLLVYRKNESADLTAEQKRTLALLVATKLRWKVDDAG